VEIIDPNTYGDRNGFYQVGKRKTYLKTELMEWYDLMPTDWHWNYNDEFFGQFDWSKEPKETINELYKQRALELREQYDYLALYYSGGHDSSNVLYAFLDNGIPIDEVVTYYSKYDDNNESFQSRELSQFTWHKIKKLKQLYPDLNIRILDYGDYFFQWENIIKKYGYQDDQFAMFGSMLSINRLIQDEFYELIPDWNKLISSGKKFAWIFGADKPMLRYIDGRWIFNFHDGFIHCRQTPMRQLYDDGTRGTYEYFYWSPTDACQKVIRKQCHLLVNHYNEQAKIDFSQIPGHKPFKPGYGWEMNTMTPSFVETIYPRLFRYDEKYYTEKTSKFIFGGRDQWFFNSNHDSAIAHKKMWEGLNSVYHSHYNWLKNDGVNIENGLKNCISNDYVIKNST